MALSPLSPNKTVFSSTFNIIEQNQTPEIVQVYKRIRSTIVDTLSTDHLIEIAKIILKKPAEKRNATDIKLLVECTKQVKFFMDLVCSNGKEIHENCCKYMTMEFFNENDTVFEIGSQGQSFYIILKGSVGVLVNIPKTIETINEKGEATQTIELVLTDVKTLYSGSSFGELALLDNKPRAATIKCKEDCYFAVLNKSAFDNILKQKEKKKIEEEVNFLKSLDLFSSWTYHSLKSLYYHTNKKIFTMKSIVYKEGEEPSHFYFIRSGEFQIEIPVQLPLSGSLLYKQKFENRVNNKYSILRKETMNKQIKFLVLGEKQFFGAEELIDSNGNYNNKRDHTVICISETAEVSIINKKEFLRKIYNDPISKEFLIQHVNKLKDLRNSRISEYISVQKFHGMLRCPTLREQYSLFSEKPLILNQSVHKTQDKSLYNLLETSNSNIMLSPLNTEPCESQSQISQINLSIYSEKHKVTMNLHRKLKSLQLEKLNSYENEHISSRFDALGELRNAFKPEELVKLKAFRAFDRKQRQMVFSIGLRERKKLDEDNKIPIPKIVQRKIRERMEINKILTNLNAKLEKNRKKFQESEGFIKKFVQKKPEKTETEEKREKPLSSLHSLNKFDKRLLPLKYNIDKYISFKSKKHV